MARVRLTVMVMLLCVSFVAAAVYLTCGAHVTPARRVSLAPSSADPVSLPLQKNKLRIAVGAIISPAESLTFYEDIFDYIGEKLGRSVEMVLRTTYTEVNFLLKEGRIDAAFVCSRPYVEGHRDFGMELLCAPVCFGKTEYHSYLIVHKDSSIQKLEDLRGKVFAFSDPLSNTGMLVPVCALARMGETPESFFRRHIFTYSHDNSIRSVAEKFVDAAAVDSLIWEYLNAKGQRWPAQTRIIDRSEPFGIPPLVVSPDIDSELKEKLRSAFLNMHDDPKGREILDMVLIDRFTEIEDSAYDSIREMETLLRDTRLDK